MTRKLSRKAVVLGAGALALLLVVGTAVAGGMGPGKFGERWKHGFVQSDDLVTSDRASFRVDADAGAISEYDLTLKDDTTLRFLESAAFADWSADEATTASRGPAYVLVDGDLATLVISDRGLVARSVAGNTLTLTLPEGATVALHDAVEGWSPEGASVTYADGAKASLVVGKNSTVTQDSDDLVVTIAAGDHVAYRLGPLGHGPGGLFGNGGPEGGPWPHDTMERPDGGFRGRR